MTTSQIVPSNDGERREEVPWQQAYPSPKTTASAISCSELRNWMLTGKEAGKDFVLVDLRRNDHEGGTIKGSINLPAQSLYPSIPVLYRLFSAASVKHVIFYCSSSRGRGPRAAGWFADHLKNQQDANMASLVLEGGIKGWVAEGGKYVELMEGFEPAVWHHSD